MNKAPILALAAAALLSASGLANAQGTPDTSQSPREQTKDQMQQPGGRSGAEPRATPEQTKPGADTDQNMRNTQMQGRRNRDQMQCGEHPQGGQMLRGGEERGEGARPLSVEQKTTLRETVLSRGPRVTNINFRIGVGAVVPRSVHIIAVPQPILAIYPEWASDLYFVYGDEIIVVAPDTMEIVGVLPL